MEGEILKAWIAGFFDGEGCVFVSYSKNKSSVGGYRFALMATITQQDRRPLDMIRAIYGGHMTKRGAETEAYRRKLGNFFCYHWRVTDGLALKFLADIRNYSIVKQSQIDVALEYPLGRQWRRTTDEERDKRLSIHGELLSIRRAMKEEVDVRLR